MSHEMLKREIGRSGIKASAIGLGTWAIGGWMWGGTDEARSIAAIQASIEAGVSLIDTAPAYGQGVAEEIVGKAIKGEVEPVPGGNPDEDIVVTNTEYWMGPDITVATATQGRVRAYGRVWDFDGRSAEICQIDWSGPAAEQAA